MKCILLYIFYSLEEITIEKLFFYIFYETFYTKDFITKVNQQFFYSVKIILWYIILALINIFKSNKKIDKGFKKRKGGSRFIKNKLSTHLGLKKF